MVPFEDGPSQEFRMNAVFLVGNRRVTIRYSAPPALRSSRKTPSFSVTTGPIVVKASSGSIPDGRHAEALTRQLRAVAWGRLPTLGTPILHPSWPHCVRTGETGGDDTGCHASQRQYRRDAKGLKKPYRAKWLWELPQ